MRYVADFVATDRQADRQTDRQTHTHIAGVYLHRGQQGVFPPPKFTENFIKHYAILLLLKSCFNCTP